MTRSLVAIAGGTGTIGNSIISALTTNTNTNYTPIILSRQTSQHPSGSSTISPSGIQTRYVNYALQDSLVQSLTDIHTVISALLIPGPEFIPYQLNLLGAAQAAGCTRFAPSEFALSFSAHQDVEIDHAKIVVWDAVRKAVDEGSIDAALFPCGMFMNYLGIGAPHATEALAGFREGPLLFHFEDPGKLWIEAPVREDGTEFPLLTMTDIRDVGKFVAAALEIEKPWGGRELGMAGDTLGLGEVIELCRRYVGREKEIEIRTVTKEELQRRVASLDPGDILGKMECEYTMVCGRGGSVVQPTLNALCPRVRPFTVKEYLERYWAE